MWDSSPSRLRVDAASPDALFDASAPAVFPHRGRMVASDLADHLEKRVRQHPRGGHVTVEIHLPADERGDSSQQPAAAESFRAYFRQEREIVELDLRVNQREGWGFLLRMLPILIVALGIAGLFYVLEPTFVSESWRALAVALVYLVFITIVWVLLWDPIEKLLFDAFLLRARIHALARLADATVEFARGPPP